MPLLSLPRQQGACTLAELATFLSLSICFLL